MSNSILESRLNTLSLKERDAYSKYISANKPALAPSTSAGLFALYSQGFSLEEISQLNPSLGLGIIVKASIEESWNEKRQAHLDNLLDMARQTVQKTQLETIKFLCTAIAAYQKSVGDKFSRYLQTNDPKLLVDSNGDELLSFKKFVTLTEMLQALTNTEQKVGGEITVTHNHTNKSPATIDILSAEDILKRLDSGLKGK
jgi:hypothetical protein